MEHVEMEQKGKINKNRKNIGKFIAVALLTLGLAAGWFLLWAYVSYELRFSAEVIRAGLVLLYIVPCMLGGRILRLCMRNRALIGGAGLGAGLYALLVVLAVAGGETIEFTQTHAVNFALCVLSGIAGTLRFRRSSSDSDQ